MQRQVAVALLLVCCTVLVNSASVGVVRVPRVYNVLIRSDGALAPSEAVSADSAHSLSQHDETRSQSSNDDESHQEDEEANDEVDGEEQGEEIEKEDPLPILDPKMGAIQDGVNYTAVPLSRAYPLTRYTAPIIAAHYPISYLSPLHGGLILGPVPRLPASLQQQQQQQQQYQQQVPQEEERTDLGSVPSLQSSVYDSPPRQQRQQQSASLPTGAFEDYDRDSVAVEAEDDQQQN